MKKVYLLIIFFTVSLGGWSQLLTEQFNYTPDAVLGLSAQSQSGGSPWAIINTGDSILVDAASLTYPGLAASAGNKAKFDGAGTDYYTNFTSQTTGSVYRSFILNVSALGSLTTTGGYFNGFIQSGSTSLFGATVWTRLSTTAGKFNVGISTRSNSVVTWLATDLTPGTPCFIVVAYDFNPGVGDDVARIWLNTAAIGGSEPAADATAAPGTDLTSAARVFLRQDNATNTPFIEFDELRVGTTWVQVTPPAGGSPTLSAGALTGFGNVCTNTTSAANSFTITGTSLTSANVTVAALPGFTYSTTSGGSYTSTLGFSIPGSTTQQVFVKFSPTAVQSYNGTIVVGGGGASNINVAATGSGVNTIPSVTTGAASAITSTTATLAGSISTNGCTSISGYGVKYSTTAGFDPTVSGTTVASSNLSGGNFSSDLTSLTPSTQYYYHAYATNGGGTAYGTEQTFTTSAAVPTLSANTLADFGNLCTNTTSVANSFTITGANLTAVNVTVAALAGFTYSTTSGGSYTSTLSFSMPGSTTQQVFVKFSPTAVQSYNGNIVVGGGGASNINVAATGAGVNTIPSVTTGAASAITTTTATLAGSITSFGCTSITGYGVKYSTTAGFDPVTTGTAVASSNLSGNNFSSDLIGLTQNTQYYYHAYATNGGGTAYGTEQTFTTQATTPTLSATTLAPFGSVCINTTTNAGSFTINASALTAANIDVAALPGFTYSLTGVTYTTSLSLVQPGGTFTQQIFVKFTPVAVQSYNGNIVVSGGGAPVSINVAASGAGINTTPTVTTGAASAITSISAILAGTLPTTGCSAITGYGVKYSTINGFDPVTTGTTVASSNLSGVNFSSNAGGLTPSTVYYYRAYATNNGGTVYGVQQTFTTATPVLSAGALLAFGNVCTNATGGPNSFTITGTNLTTANVTVGPLAGFTFSTGGAYTASLNLTQASGPYSQAIFVIFTPVAVQSYNGNIPVTGGGASSINVAATGAGINTAPTVTTGAASAITQITATTAGSIPVTGCTSISAYGVKFSTTNGFDPLTTGTTVASSNLSGVNFSSNLSGLAPSTVYYYRAFATNGGGTTYGAQLSFTTSAPVLTTTALTGFGAVCINNTVGPNTFTINSTALTAANINVGPLGGYTFSTASAGPYTASLSLTQPGGTYSQTIYVKFTPVAVQSYNGNIPVSGGGAVVTINVAASGSGTNTVASVTTGSATVLSPSAANLNGTITSIGCSPVTGYGIEYSGISGFANGNGIKVASSNLNAGAFSSFLTGLVQNSTYYYKAYAVNNGGIAYGTQQTFTTPAIPTGLVIYSNPITRGGTMHFTLDGIKPGHYAAIIYDMEGKLMFKKDMIVMVNFIDDYLTVPVTLGTGEYSFRLASIDFTKEKTFMVW